MREVPSVPWRGQSAAWAAALDAIAAIRATPSKFMDLRARICRDISIISLGVAYWVMREAVTQTSWAILSNRRGAFLGAVVAKLHEADLGDLIARSSRTTAPAWCDSG